MNKDISLKNMFKRKSDYIFFGLMVLLCLCIPIGAIIIISLSFSFLFAFFKKGKAILFFLVGLIISVFITFFTFLAIFQPFSNQKVILYPNIEMSSSQKALYDEIVNYSGYYLPESINIYEDDEILFVSLGLKTHYLGSSVGNKKNSYAYKIYLKKKNISKDYIFQFKDQNGIVLEEQKIAKSLEGVPDTDVQEFIYEENGYISIYYQGEEIYITQFLKNEPIDLYERAPMYELNTWKGFLKLMICLDAGLIFNFAFTFYILIKNEKKKKQKELQQKEG